MIIKKILCSMACSLSFFAMSASAVTASLHFSSSIGSLNGETRSYVYDPSTQRKLSQLNWEFKNVPILKGDWLFDYNDWLSFDLNAWGNILTKQGVMNDYDWLDPMQSHWTDWSYHKDTTVHQVNTVDLNIRAWLLRSPHTTFGITGGYQRQFFDFNVKGGCYNYSNGAYQGCFDSFEPVIQYQQSFKMPYMGLIGKYEQEAFRFDLIFKYSPNVDAEDIDQHLLRDVVFYSHGDKGQLFEGALKASYAVKQNAKFFKVRVFAEANYTAMTRGKTDTTVLYSSTMWGPFVDAGAISNHNYSLFLGAQLSI